MSGNNLFFFFSFVDETLYNNKLPTFDIKHLLFDLPHSCDLNWYKLVQNLDSIYLLSYVFLSNMKLSTENPETESINGKQ